MPSSTRVSAPAERLAASGAASSTTAVDVAADAPASSPRLTGAVWWPAALILLLCGIAIFAPVLAPYPPNTQLDIIALKSRAPSLAHPFGTDQYSRDLLSRMLFGARISLSVAMLAVLLSATIGTVYGLAAGFLGGRIDAVMMRVLDAWLAIPRVLLLVALLEMWSPVPIVTLILIIGFTGWFEVSRLVRAEVLSVVRREYIVAARALGVPASRIVWRHILPNVLNPILISAALGVGNVIILEAGLSYLGIGARAPTASWGSIFYDGSEAFHTTWWIALFPGLAIIITVVAFNLLGTALRDALDPHQLAGDFARR